jgi:YaiO family outer membrane protein
MNSVRFYGGTALFACAVLAVASASAAAPMLGVGPVRATPSNLRSTVGFRVEYTDFSKLYGDRVLATAESHFGLTKETQLSFNVSSGRRSAGHNRVDATLVSGAIDHDWTDRLSTHASVSLASNGSIFAKQQVVTDVSHRLVGGLIATAGVKYADYGGSTRVSTWSVGPTYYLRGASLSYRFNLLESHQLGRSYAHLASFRINDPSGSGSTQLWLGRGNSLYEVSASPAAAEGKFSSLALVRRQPLAEGVTLNIGANRTWYATPHGSYQGTGFSLGLTAARFHL